MPQDDVPVLTRARWLQPFLQIKHRTSYGDCLQLRILKSVRMFRGCIVHGTDMIVIHSVVQSIETHALLPRSHHVALLQRLSCANVQVSGWDSASYAAHRFSHSHVLVSALHHLSRMEDDIPHVQVHIWRQSFLLQNVVKYVLDTLIQIYLF